MADPRYGEQDGWPPGVAPPAPPPTMPYVAPPPPPPGGYQPPPPVYPAYPAMPYPPHYVEAPKSKVAAALLAFFLGTFGIHNFYLGRTSLGLTQLLVATIGGIFTCGISTLVVSIWAFVEFILILSGNINDSNGRPLA